MTDLEFVLLHHAESTAREAARRRLSPLPGAHRRPHRLLARLGGRPRG